MNVAAMAKLKFPGSAPCLVCPAGSTETETTAHATDALSDTARAAAVQTRSAAWSNLQRLWRISFLLSSAALSAETAAATAVAAVTTPASAAAMQSTVCAAAAAAAVEEDEEEDEEDEEEEEVDDDTFALA